MQAVMQRQVVETAQSAASPAPELDVRFIDLVKQYGPLRAVDHVSLDVARGEFLTLLGPSGSGKSTLLMMLAGFAQPTAGRIEVNGRDVTRLPPERRNFGVVFQGYALFPHMTVAENVAYPLKARGFLKPEISAKLKRALSLVRLEGLADRYPRQLSGGQQQRVAIARALSFSPEIVLFDEPLGALDRKLRGEVQAEFRMLHQQLGTTFIYVTHDQDEALSMSDRIAILERGRLVQCGTPVELYERPVNRFVAGFLGTSNCFPGTVTGRDGGFAIIITGGGATIRHRSDVLATGDRVLLSIRPEKLGLGPAGHDETDVKRLGGRVRSISYLGAQFHLVVETEALGAVSVTRPAGEAGMPVEGGDVTLHWRTDAMVELAPDN